MGDVWTGLSDDVTLGMSDQVRIAVSFGCTPFSQVTAADIKNFLAQDKDVTAVLDVAEGWIDTVTLGLSFNCNYLVTVNPANGTKAGDLRGAMYQAVNKANDLHIIKSDNILVGAIEKKGSALEGAISSVLSPPSASTTISLAAVAIIAVVGLVLFLKID